MKNTQHARYRFGKAIQNDNETINQYELRLREYALKCDFAGTDEKILSHLILTIRDDKFRHEALNKRYVLKDFSEKAQAKEDVHIQALETEGRRDLDSVNRTLTHHKKTGFKQTQHVKLRLTKHQVTNQLQNVIFVIDTMHLVGTIALHLGKLVMLAGSMVISL